VRRTRRSASSGATARNDAITSGAAPRAARSRAHPPGGFARAHLQVHQKDAETVELAPDTFVGEARRPQVAERSNLRIAST